MSSEKFKNIPVDKETEVIGREEVKIGEYDAIHEKWLWEAIRAESYIFANEDIKKLSQEELLSLVGKVGATYKKSDRYTFVNFGFEVL